jgi:hypothetical protein
VVGRAFLETGAGSRRKKAPNLPSLFVGPGPMLCGTFRPVGGKPVQDNRSELPEFLLSELPNLPRQGDRKTLAQLISKFIFPVSPRTLESWPLHSRRVNGHAVAETYEALALAWRKFNSAPVTMSGRGRSRVSRDSELSEANVDRETAA